MAKLTHSLVAFLAKKHPDLIPFLIFGHVELFTDEIQNEYMEWLKTDEGKEALKETKNETD